MILPKFAAAYEERSALSVDRGAGLQFGLIGGRKTPLNEGAIAKSDGSIWCSADFRDLPAGSPKRAVYKPYRPTIGRCDTNHGRIWTVERDKFAICDQQAHGSALIDDERRLAIVRTDSEEVTITTTAF